MLETVFHLIIVFLAPLFPLSFFYSFPRSSQVNT